MGRFIVWTQGAFEKMNALWGSVNRESTQKSGYTVPRNMMTNSDITRLINSDEVQSKCRDPVKVVKGSRLKKNPLKNFGVKVRLNPYAQSLRRSELLAQERRAAGKAAKVKQVRNKAARQTANFARIRAD